MSASPHHNPSVTRRAPVLDAASIEAALATLQNRIDLLQQSLAQQNKLATLGMVTAVIAHEFNNILTPMISYTRFAMSDKADEAMRQKALTKALSGSERLANISKSLLGFARGDETASAPVMTAVRETLACLARDPSKDGITLTIDMPEDLCAGINAGHLQQVLMNLIVNARSAMLARSQTGGGGGGVKRITIRGQKRGKTVEIHHCRHRPGHSARMCCRTSSIPSFPPKKPASRIPLRRKPCRAAARDWGLRFAGN